MSDLPVISGDTIAVGTFNRKWLKQLTIFDGKFVVGTLIPYDGQGNILETPICGLRIMVKQDAQLGQLVGGILALMQARAGQSSLPNIVRVDAPHPAQPARATGVFGIHTPQYTEWVLEDIFALAAVDQQVAMLLGGLLAWVAAANQYIQVIP